MLHDICSTSNLVHPPFKVKFFNMINLFGLLQDMMAACALCNVHEYVLCRSSLVNNALTDSRN